MLSYCSMITDIASIPHRIIPCNGCCLVPPSGVTHHGGPSVADEGRLGAQVLSLHDAGRRDGERDQVEGEDHSEEGTKNSDLRGCRHRSGNFR